MIKAATLQQTALSILLVRLQLMLTRRPPSGTVVQGLSDSSLSLGSWRRSAFRGVLGAQSWTYGKMRGFKRSLPSPAS